MTTVTVYYFMKYDIVRDEFVKSKRHATLETIKKVGGELIHDTAQEVDATQLDRDGLLAKK